MTESAETGDRGWWRWAVAALVGAVVVAVAAWLVLRDDTYVAPPRPDAVTQQPRPALAAVTLDRLVTAIDRRDTGAAARLAPDGDDGAADLLGDVVVNARDLRVKDLELRYVDETGPVTSDGTWTAAVDVQWLFAGFDARPAHEEVQVRFALAGDRVAVVGFGGGGRRTPLWLAGPLQVRRSATTLVLTTGSAAVAQEYAGLAGAAVPVVRRVLPRWRARLVLEVPSSEDQLDDALAAAPGTYDNIAAVTAPVDGTAVAGTPIHVFVNPAVLGRLEPAGAQIVISHEATHVATRAPLSSTPTWLVEGFADYVALRDVDLPIRTTAGQVIGEVRKDGPPRELPTAADFADTSDALGAVYEAAWVACTLVAADAGQAGLVDLYDRTDGGQELGPALRAVLGLDTAQFTRAWRQRLTTLAARDAA